MSDRPADLLFTAILAAVTTALLFACYMLDSKFIAFLGGAALVLTITAVVKDA